jgi:hypothetical protein
VRADILHGSLAAEDIPRVINRQDKALPQTSWDGIPLTQ